MLPKFLQLGLNVCLLESIILNSGEHLSIDLPALGIAILDFNTVIQLVNNSFELSIRRYI